MDTESRLNNLEVETKRISDIENNLRQLQTAFDFHAHKGIDGTNKVQIYDQKTKSSLLTLSSFAQSVSTGFTVTPLSSYVVLTSTGAVTSSTTMAVATAVEVGQIVLLRGTSDSNTVTIVNTAGTKLTSDCTLKNQDILLLIWDSTKWVEISRVTH